MIRFYEYKAEDKYYLLIDGRQLNVARFKKRDIAHALCLQYGTSGMGVVEESETADFMVSAFGADGEPQAAEAPLLACAVAFADVLGVKPFHTKDYTVSDTGTIHIAYIDSHLGETKMVSIDSSAAIEALNLGDLVE